MATPEQWLAKLAKLKVDRASGDPAPHKPLLVLVVLELAEQGLLPNQELPLTPELAFRFKHPLEIVASRRKQRVVSFDRSLPWQAIRNGSPQLIELPE